MVTLFDPIKIGSTVLKNRIILAPLTRLRATDNGEITDIMVEYYRQRASAGLEITEGTQISDIAQGYGRTPGFHNSAQLAGWKKIVDAVHTAESLICAQLWHTGRISHHSLHENEAPPHSPTAEHVSTKTTLVLPDGTPQRTQVSPPEQMTISQIHETVKEYETAAKNAQEIGFDFVEVHAAHGYLLHEFQAKAVNTRTDEYGGSIENRARFTLEALDAAIAGWDKDHVGIRISPWGKFNDIATEDDELTYYLIGQIAQRNIAYLHLSEPDWAGGEPLSLENRKKLRENYPGVIIAAGGYRLEKAEPLLESGLIDAAAFGRTFISNPDLPTRLQQKAELNPLRTELVYGFGAEGYTDYPTLSTSDT